MKWVNAVSGQLKKWTIGIRRFPGFLGFGIAMCAYLSYHIQTDGEPEGRVFWSLWIAALISMATEIYLETYEGSRSRFLAATLGLSSLGLLYGLLEPGAMGEHYWQNIFCGVVVAILHMLITLLPIKRRNDESLLRYNFLLLENFLSSFLIAVLLFTTLSLAVLSVSTLFDLSTQKINLYAHLATWTLIGIQMVNFIALFPTLPLDTAAQARFKSRFFEVVFNYIGVPVMGVYAIIMLAYLLKVLTTGEAVVPWISELCCWYMGLGIVVYLGSRTLLLEKESKAAQLYIKGFFPSILLGLVLLGKAWMLQYENMGIREEVYLLALAWIYGALIFIIFILKKTPDLRLIPGLVMLLLVVYIFPGPLNVKVISKRNQEFVLKNKAGNAGLLVNGKLVKAQQETQINTDTISQLVQYLYQRHDLHFLKEYDQDGLLGDTFNIDTLKSLWMLKGMSYLQKPDEKRIYRSNGYLPELEVKEESKVFSVETGPLHKKGSFSGLVINDRGGLSRMENGVEKARWVVLESEISEEKISISREGNHFDIYYKILSYVRVNEHAKLIMIEGLAIQTKEDQ